MALQSQVWSSATPMPMAESSLYRQRLEVIAVSDALPVRSAPRPGNPQTVPMLLPCVSAIPGSRPTIVKREKRRLQEEIRAALRELEDEKLRVERLKRKSLRERWLMDGAAEGPDRPEDPTSQDPQSPEGQAQARIQNLEDSLFTLQSQLQLLQSASTGAQHKPSGRPTWRRQGHRPLSQPTVEAGVTGHTDLDKRASLPAWPVGVSPESPSEPREEAVGVLPAPRRVPGAVAASSEANGPCLGPSPPPEQEPSQGVAATEGRVGEDKEGGVVKVVWEGLRATEDCATGATGLELEAKVEEVVQEAIGDRQGAGSLELPAWVKEDRGTVEVVWEGVGGSDSEATGEVGMGPGAAQTSLPRFQERWEEAASREGEGAPRGSPEGRGEEGSFIWVERVTLSEDWEELLVEGLEGPLVTGREGGDEGSLGAERRGGEETWEVERRRAEESAGIGKRGSEDKPGTEGDRAEMPLVEERKRSEESLKPESRGGEEKLGTEREGGEEPLGLERKEGEGLLRAERERGEEMLGVEKKEVEEPLEVEEEGGEEKPEASEEPLVTEIKGGEQPLAAEEKGDEEPSQAEEKGGEEPSQAEEKGGEEPSQAEEKGGEEPSQAEEKGGEEPSQAEEKGGEEPSQAEEKGGEEPSQAEEKGGEEPSQAEEKGGEEPSQAEEKGGEGPSQAEEKEGEGPSQAEEKGGDEPLQAEEKGGEQPLELEKTQGAKEDLSPEEQRAPGAGTESQAEEVSDVGAPLGANEEEPSPEEEGLQPQEKQEGSLEEEAVKPQTPAEGQDPSGGATPLLAETPATPEQPTECQPLLHGEEPSANPSVHPAPTYAPARQPEPSAPTEGEEASGPKQKTCQCCAVM
ncbi:PREDICTED: paralemmin-3 [Galeopterus variegatus]|uniref:Paralemmin-3 n=1 Tax=Galeopterus variegatus TaxID=482537 RepID=A0ABM0Q7C4_GALVR|nr:PREDICTED: paralemmin-3 [Galeopterus variegatus]